MSKEKWNEAGRVWEDDHTWLDDEQQAECARAHESAMFQSPIPTQMISNGEYMPAPQTAKQKQVEQRIQELSESASRKLGMDRRRFLSSTGGTSSPLRSKDVSSGTPESIFHCLFKGHYDLQLGRYLYRLPARESR